MTDAADALADHLSTIPTSTGFTVDTLDKAMWAARLIARNDRKVREAEQAMNAQIDAIAAWFDAEKQRHDTSFLREQLVRYHRTVVDDELASGVSPGKVQKTIPLVDGVTLTRRAAKGSVEVVDADLLPSDCVTWAPVPVKQNIRKRVDAGEDVPGARLVLPADADDSGFTWTVRVATTADGDA